MIWHPLILLILALDGAALLLTAGMVWHALPVTLHWNPARTDQGQIRLETRAEILHLLIHWLFGMQLLTAVLFTTAVAITLPGLVPGAMCGTGVMQAMERTGGPALTLRAAALLILCLMDRASLLNRTHPLGPLTPRISRLAFLAAPVILLAISYTASGMLNLGGHPPVSCCAVVYALIPGGGEQLPSLRTIPAAAWITLLVLSSLLILVNLAGLRRATTAAGIRTASGMLMLTTPLWLLTAGGALIRVLTAYIYQVLHHPCPWCLFLPQHRGIGFLLFLLLAVAGLDGLTLHPVIRMGSVHPDLAPRLIAHSRRHAALMIWAVAVFCLCAGLPALLWRWRFGVWIGGGV